MIKIFNRDILPPRLNNPEDTIYNSNTCFERTKSLLGPNCFRYYGASNISDLFYRSGSNEQLEQNFIHLSSQNNANSFNWNKDVFKVFHEEILASDPSLKCFIQPNENFKSDFLHSSNVHQSLISLYEEYYSHAKFYTKPSLVGSWQEKKVYSNYPKVFFDNLKDFYVSSNFSPLSVSPLSREYSRFRKNDDERKRRNFITRFFNNQTFEITQNQKLSSLDLLTISFDTLHASLNKNKYNCLLLPSWSSRNNQTPSFVNLTPKQTNKRNGLFVPILTKINLLNENLEQEEVFYFSLALISSKSPDFSFLLATDNFKPAALNSLVEFMDLVFFQDGIFFNSEEEYYRRKTSIISSLVMTPLKKKVHSPTTQLYLKDLESISDEIIQSSPLLYNTISNDCLKYLSPKMSTTNYKKIADRINNLKNKANSKIKDQLENLSNLQTLLNIHLSFHKDYILTKYRVQKFSTFKPTIDLSLFNQSVAMFSSTVLMQNKQSTFLANYLESIYNNKDTKDFYGDTLINLTKENVHIEKIIYTDPKTKERNVIDNTSSKNEVISFLTSSLQEKSFELFFIVNKTIPVYVDGKIAPKAIKAAGPYRLKLSVFTNGSFNLNIAPLNAKTIFVKQNSQLVIHPHASSFTAENILAAVNSQNYSNCCLGEAVSTISWALKKEVVDIGHVILSTMLWLTSANSTDIWGKRYKDFPDYNDFDFESSNLIEEPSQEEINAFLSSEDDSETEEETEVIEETNHTPVLPLIYTRYTNNNEIYN